jgi:amidohydrolase
MVYFTMGFQNEGMPLKRIKEKINREVDAIADDLFSMSGKIYEHPETAYQEQKACEWLSRFLEERNFVVQRRAGNIETAFFAKPAGLSTRGRPTVAFLAEYDALPKIGHGCGHNLICMASLGAGIVLSKCLGGIEGSLVVVGTPAEEGGAGKIKLYEAGVFDEIDAAMMFHPDNRNTPGDDLLGRIRFKVEFLGKSSHAADRPHLGVNALDAIILLFNNINALRQQITQDGRIHGIISHGGDAPNVIPDYTAGLFYVRAQSLEYLQDLFEKVQNCVRAAATATGTDVKILREDPIYEPLKRNNTLEAVCRQNMEALGLTIDTTRITSGSSDIGNLSRKLPTIHPYLAICDRSIPGHSAEFGKATRRPQGRDALIKATKMLAWTALDYLASPEIQRKVAEEFQPSG